MKKPHKVLDYIEFLNDMLDDNERIEKILIVFHSLDGEEFK